MRHFVIKKKIKYSFIKYIVLISSIINDLHKWVNTFTPISIHNKS